MPPLTHLISNRTLFILQVSTYAHYTPQDSHEREYINCDVYLQQIFNRQRIKFQEIPQLLSPLLMQPEPVVIHHTVSVDPADAKKQSCYDITVSKLFVFATSHLVILLSFIIIFDEITVNDFCI